MFVLSHLCGPLIGLALAGFLLLLGFPPDHRLAGFAVLVCLFWAYPPALSAGVGYRLLCLTSLQHLTFVIFWASHGYGGLTSPFLLWLAIVPLLAFLYSAPRVRLWLLLLAILGLSTGAFAAYAMFVVEPPPADPDALRWLALLSSLSAAVYVSMMAIYFGRLLSSRNEMALEVARRREELIGFDERATELRQMRAARIASLTRISRDCKQPIDEILADCRSDCSSAYDNRGSQMSGDIANIEVAALRLRALIADVDRFRTGLLHRPVARSTTGVNATGVDD